ncbi:LamG domain-containing protein, partial [candidate division KSB1 bacterium]|nr:LamG domain-containing protein [candidate division KSB1 bacterium]
ITESEIPLNQWTHVATVANQETGEVIMYLDGRRVGRIDQLKPYVRDKNILYIGYQVENPAFFAGSIDEVRVHDTALNDDEVYSIYKMN